MKTIKIETISEGAFSVVIEGLSTGGYRTRCGNDVSFTFSTIALARADARRRLEIAWAS